MPKPISNWIRKRTTGRLALVALAIFALFIGFVLPGQAGKADARPEGSDSPDSSFLYTPGDLYAMAEAYGEAGREDYVEERLTFDLVWPLVYAFFLTTAIAWTYDRAFVPESPWQLANLAPVAGALLDYLENISTSLVMARYPARTPGIAQLAPAFTTLKWIFVGGSFVLLFIGGAAALWKMLGLPDFAG